VAADVEPARGGRIGCEGVEVGSRDPRGPSVESGGRLVVVARRQEQKQAAEEDDDDSDQDLVAGEARWRLLG